MKEIQKKYKQDKQKRQNEELMKFYRENQINPAASCLPMLVAVADLLRPLLGVAALREARPQESDISCLRIVPKITRRRTSTGGGMSSSSIYVTSQMAPPTSWRDGRKMQRYMFMIMPDRLRYS